MPGKEKADRIQIDEDFEFQKRSWVVQRVGWVIFTLVLVLAFLGLFGDGLLSDAKAGQENGALWLEYPRFARLEHELHITAHANSASWTGEEIILQLDKGYLEGFEVKSISPVPEVEISEAGHITYVFKVNQPNSPFTAHFYLEPQSFGLRSGSFQWPGGEAIRFSQFIYP